MDGIEAYLDELSGRLKLSPSATRRLLAETEAHLRDTADAEIAAGAAAVDAEKRALERFGTPREVARAANGGALEVIGAGVIGVAQLVAVGSAAVIAGTLLAELLATITSTNWVFGPQSGFAPSSEQVSHWLQVQPTAHGWRDAAAMENAADSLVLRGGAAVVVLVVALAVLRTLRGRSGRISGGVVPAVGVTAFGGAAVVLAVSGATGSVAMADWGRGQAICDAVVALLAAITYLVICARAVFVTP